MHVTALQDRCIAKEGVVARIRRHNTHLMEEQGQYKEAVCTLNRELKEVREKLVEAGRQNEKLKGEMTVLEQGCRRLGLTRSVTSRRHNCSLIPVPGIMALVSMTALNRSRQPSQGWIFLGSPWTTEKMTPLNLLPLWRPTALWSWPSLLLTLQLQS